MYENDGAGNFSSQKIISDQTIGAIDIYPADLDADGNVDVLSVSFEDNKIAWYKNNGVGNFSEQKIISPLAIRPTEVFVADLDADGDLDVISNSDGRDGIAWYENDGIGNFSDQKIIISTCFARPSIYVADLDADGDLDVLSACRFSPTGVAWYENDGIGNFSTQKDISAPTTYGDSLVLWRSSIIHVADLDADGDLDVLSKVESNDNEKVVWYENLLEITTSIDYSVIENRGSISPNPFEDFFTIDINSIQLSNSHSLNLSLFDAKGQQVQSVILKDTTQQISTAHLANGLYFYQVINSDGQMIANGNLVKQ